MESQTYLYFTAEREYLQRNLHLTWPPYTRIYPYVIYTAYNTVSYRSGYGPWDIAIYTIERETFEGENFHDFPAIRESFL